MRHYVLRSVGIGLFIGATLMASPGPARANGINEDGAWQFKDAATRAVQASIANLILLKQSGTFGDPPADPPASINATITCQQGSLGCGTAGGSNSTSIGNFASGTSGSTQTNSNSQQGTTLPVGAPLTGN
jgi:hypothetical protein